jgi:hypothetical protein
MSLGICPDCGSTISNEAAACPKCGRLRLGKKRYLAFAASAVLILVGSSLFSIYVHNGIYGLGRTSRKAVHSAQKERIEYFYSLRADCAIDGIPEVTVVRAPSQGSVSTEQGQAYPQYARANIRFECDRNLAESTLVFYQSKANFHGSDSFTISVRFPDSSSWTESYIVKVL